ncbi:hypothetical protein KEM52_002628, partial [Ascosphaera acerosa]
MAMSDAYLSPPPDEPCQPEGPSSKPSLPSLPLLQSPSPAVPPAHGSRDRQLWEEAQHAGIRGVCCQTLLQIYQAIHAGDLLAAQEGLVTLSRWVAENHREI